MELYQWQKDCLNAWEKNNYRGIVNVVTGGGKTFLALSAIKELRKKYPSLQVKVVVPTLPLAYQWMQQLARQACSKKELPGFFGGGTRDDPTRNVMVYIINSARYTLSRHIQKNFALSQPVLLICDECHHYQSRENRRIFDFLDTAMPDSALYCCLGLSATPFDTQDDDFLRRVLGPEIYHYSFSEASYHGILSPFSICEISLSFLAEEQETYDRISFEIFIALQKIKKIAPELSCLSESAFLKNVTHKAKEAQMDPSNPYVAFLVKTYERKRITVMARSRTQCALSLIQSLRRTDRIIVFCERIAQAEALYHLLCRYETDCSLYHSEMNRNTREKILQDFRNEQTRILISCRCLDEGIDVPDANIGIVMSSSAVNRQRIQRMGRIVRQADGKQSACLYYMYIQEASEDSVFLRDILECETFHLKYLPAENIFIHDLYEYVGSELLCLAREAGHEKKTLDEMRRCILEGLTRADFLLPPSVQKQNRDAAITPHEKNYWRVAEKISHMLHDEKTPNRQTGTE
ncbi:MAG: DEAD/DEAH box helicase [Clostridia bacterium]|nr:DEAD/DEAH box helicase [Clostridia bacterium]